VSKPESKSGVHWGSRLGVVLAVAGSAVGLGNFLRFPGQAAANGAGAFMVPYFIALLLVGIPLAWAEWSMGRYSGVRGFHSAPGIFAALCKNKAASFLGSFALLIPLMVYMYYVVIEAWCLGYAWYYLTGGLTADSGDPTHFKEFFKTFTGQNGNGDVVTSLATSPVVIFVGITFVLNFCLIMRGLNKGIETFCKFAMPVMVVCALCVLVRVLTLGAPDISPETNLGIYKNSLSDQPDNPERQLWYAMALLKADKKDEAIAAAQTGLNRINDMDAYIAGLAMADMPKDATADQIAAAQDAFEKRKTDLKDIDSAKERKSLASVEEGFKNLIDGKEIEHPNQSVAGGLNFMWTPDFSKLLSPATWLAAAGQIFFSLSVGFGVIINYSSYLRKRDDIALSGLTASTTNEFFEVCLGGLITLPAAFIFLGLTAGSFGTFDLGFSALPNVFALMPGGQIFGFLWFFMLFLAAITSSLSMLQPVGAFFEEGLGLKRSGSVMLLGLLTATGCTFVVYFSKSMAALDNIDFWCGTFLIVVLATIQSLIYGWVFGIGRGSKELENGGLIKVPGFVQFILKFITPVFLLVILGATIWNQTGTYIKNFQNDEVARYSIALIGGALLFLIVCIAIANARWTKMGKFDVFNDKES